MEERPVPHRRFTIDIDKFKKDLIEAARAGQAVEVQLRDVLMPLANKWEELFIFVNHYIPGHSIDSLNKIPFTRFFRILRQAEILHSQKMASMKG